MPSYLKKKNEIKLYILITVYKTNIKLNTTERLEQLEQNQGKRAEGEHARSWGLITAEVTF